MSSVIALLAAGDSPRANDRPDILKFADVRPGMTGTGRTVFHGSKIEEFRVEILGKLENIAPRQNLILARLSGGPLEETGVLEGMSGSPVFVDGKMLGAVSYSWGFSKEPIAGITPIEEMLRIGEEAGLQPAGETTGRASVPLRLPSSMRSYQSVLARSEILAYYDQRLARLFTTEPPTPSGLRRMSVPIALSGLPSTFLARFGPHPLLASLAASGSAIAGALDSASAGSGGSVDDPRSGTEDESPLVAGSAVGVTLMRGDVEATGIGTVTRVDGTQVLAFGHPMFNLGPVDLPMTRARVEALLPSLQSSFKLAGPAGTAGAIRSDRTTGILGQTGATARMVPVRVEINGATDAHSGALPARTFNFEITDHPLLMPQMLFMALGGIFDSTREGAGDVSIELSEGSAIRLSGDRRVSVSDLFPAEAAGLMASATVAFLSQVLLENEFEGARIEGINLVTRISDDRREARIVSAWCDHDRVHAGDTVIVSVSVRPFRAGERVIPIKLEIPRELPPGPLTLHIGDAYSLYRTGETASLGPAPRDLDDLVRLINTLRKSDRLYVVAARNEPAAWAGDVALSSLPPSKATMLQSPESSNEIQVRRMRLLFEESARSENAIAGYRRLTLEVIP